MYIQIRLVTLAEIRVIDVKYPSWRPEQRGPRKSRANDAADRPPAIRMTSRASCCRSGRFAIPSRFGRPAHELIRSEARNIRIPTAPRFMTAVETWRFEAGE